MAHGGSEAWNESVRSAVAPISGEIPTEIAFGMADPGTLADAVHRLESAGVDRIAIVRLFMSGDSFLERTRTLLGTDADRGHDSAATGVEADIDPITTASRIAIDPEGLVDGPEAGEILRARAVALSRTPRTEAVLLLGHGNGDDAVNRRLVRGMESAADVVRRAGFGEVRVETLREDWPAARRAAEARIRRWVTGRTEAGLTVIVIPFRLSGFGPYAQVLEGLDYRADGLGLLPHPAITSWIRRRARSVFCSNGWRDGGVACPIRPEDESTSSGEE